MTQTYGKLCHFNGTLFLPVSSVMQTGTQQEKESVCSALNKLDVGIQDAIKSNKQRGSFSHNGGGTIRTL